MQHTQKQNFVFKPPQAEFRAFSLGLISELPENTIMMNFK